MNKHEKISYVELPSTNIEETRKFFTQVFGWSFQEFGSEYIAFSDQGINGGFYKSDLSSLTRNGAALIVFYSESIKATQEKIEQAGGSILKPAFSFPGGFRFHFLEPGGNEFAVWSEINA